MHFARKSWRVAIPDGCASFGTGTAFRAHRRAVVSLSMEKIGFNSQAAARRGLELFAHAMSKSRFFCNFRDIFVAIAFLQDQLPGIERQVC